MKTMIYLIISLNSFADLSEKISIDKVEIVATGHCQIRKANKILKDGKEVLVSYHRWSIEPGGDVSKFDARVQRICKSAWTPEVVKKFKDDLKIQNERLNRGP